MSNIKFSIDKERNLFIIDYRGTQHEFEDLTSARTFADYCENWQRCYGDIKAMGTKAKGREV